jgi:DNA-binding GntR family transcriptional regulator
VSRTVADAAYQRLRVDILQGRYEPGARLPLSGLSAKYGASSGALREILPRLVEQGLVVATPQHGFRIMSLSPSDIVHLTEARVSIECLTLRQSVEHGDVSWESSVLAAHHRLARTELNTPDGQLAPAWMDVHAEFHRVLLAGCPNPRLRDIAESLRDVSEVYRWWSRPADVATHRDVAGEHRHLAETAVAHDVDESVAAYQAHIELTSELLLKSLDQIGLHEK